MNTNRTCPQCGAKLDSEAPEGLCPQCLLKVGLATRASGPSIESAATQTINPAAGTRVRYFGDYELLEEIARGGMGVVYKARQASLNRVVALKMIRSGELASDDEVKRFRVEAEAAANLQHPNIVAIHEVGMHDGRHYFTMDFVEGRDLARVADGKPMPAQRAARYVKTIAEAVHFAHQRGTLHRDLKPQNVLIDASDHVRITDFGLAKQTQRDSSLTESGVAMGSPSYMPPEQAQGRRDLVGPASDVYSLGAVLYELLTGRAPFLGDTPVATMMKVVEQEPDAPSKLEPNVPRDLETICLKCLEKSPERRYASARALTEELERFLNGEPILARPANAFRKAVSWSRRHRNVTTAAVSVLILALVGLAYGLWQQTQYLTWLNAHPGQVKAAGPRTAWLKGGGFGSFAFLLLIYIQLFYMKLSRRVSWKQVFDPINKIAPRHPVALGWIAFFCAAGVTGIAASLYYSTKSIEAFVWEGYISWRLVIGIIYPAFFFGLMLLTRVLREQASSSLGLQPIQDATQLTPEQLAPIHAALFAGRRSEAMKLYSEATGTGPRAAEAVIMQIATHLYNEQPQKFAANPLRMPLNLARLFVLSFGGGAALAVGSLFLPASVLPSWPVSFVAGVVAGCCIVWMRRFRRFWQRCLCLMPAFMLMGPVSEFTKAHNPGTDYMLPWFVGFMAGWALIWSSRKKEWPVYDSATAAGVAGTASQVPVVASAASVGFLGAILGPLIGIFGGYLGAKASIENTRSPRERQFMVRMTWWVVAGVIVFCAALFALSFWGRSLMQTHPGWFAVALTSLIVVYVAALLTFILRSNRRQRQIQIEEAQKSREETSL